MFHSADRRLKPPLYLLSSLILGLACLGAPLRLTAQTGTTRRPPAKAAVPQAQPGLQSKYKGIWEPISYPDDLMLMDVFFVTADEGWVGGGTNELSGGVILHTTDGGDHWEVQLGDPQSSDRAVKELRFLDSTHGWAVQGGTQLFHTRDGKNWTLAGTMDAHHDDYMFTSEKTGVQLRSYSIYFTADGGRSWKPVFECTAKVQIEGLWQTVGCRFTRVQFLTPSIGYAVGGNNKNMFLAKTTDGGATWKMQVSELTEAAGDVFFLDENTGNVRVGNSDYGQLYKTTDGGQTWTGIPGAPGERIQFADPEVGWALHYGRVSFTADGGNRWNSRDYRFPVAPRAFSLPRRDRAYVVGDHGMIYRYRMVPNEYTAKGMIPAALLSGIDSPLDAQVQQLATQVQQLAKDAGVPPMDFTQDAGPAGSSFNSGMNSAEAGSNPSGGAASFNAGGTMAGGAFPGSIPGCPAVGLPAAGAGFGNSTQSSTTSNAGSTAASSAASSGGFSQNTAVANPAGAAAAPSASSGAFVQDTSAATATITTVSTTVPQFVSKYRNLNMMFTGLQTATQMPATVQCLKQSFQALKNVKDPQATMAAVMNIQGQMSGLMRMVRAAFQKPH